MSKIIIKPYEEQILKIYGYILPRVPSHEGYVKIGETTRQTETRIKEQLGTAGLKHELLFERKAQRSDGTWFHDSDLHRFLTEEKNVKRKVFNDTANEWFYFNGYLQKAEEFTDEFINRDFDEVQISKDKFDYVLRSEQQLAVDETYNYYMKYKGDPNFEISSFLWNAKPRFGKTLSTYDFILRIRAENVLIVTNRPAIANSWYDDFRKFIGWRKPHLRFVSETDALKGKAFSRDDYVKRFSNDENTFGQVVFISLQDLKGARFAGGDYDKLSWVPEIDWDLLVIDEAHEGVDTKKTENVFSKIKRDFTLHLSGTPFKALANNKFSYDQIYNWSYLDEQKKKLNWNYSFGSNPYERLPTLNLFTYQLSKMIEERVSKGVTFDDNENYDYAFDLNEFFKTKSNGKFVYEESVNAFLDNLCSGKYPFAESKYQNELNHTFWLLPRVASAKAMENLLKNHHFFKDYTVVLAAGDGLALVDENHNIDNIRNGNTGDVGSLGDEFADDELLINADDFNENEKSYDKVKNAIKNFEKTITLSVGQLTTGVTIPEWTAVLMLNNIKSPSLYFQAAFRAQNPYEFVKDGKLFRKENSYIFDFAPDRTLVLYDEFAVNLNPAEDPSRKNNIKELLNFFPVIGEDEDGFMKELDAESVLSIPRLIKAKEVVKRGFMSNLLFANISGIFKAPSEVTDILQKIRPEENKRFGNHKEIELNDVHLDDDDNVKIPGSMVINTTNDIFGKKIYRKIDIPVPDFSKVTVSKKKPDLNDPINAIVKKVTESTNDSFNDFAEKFNLNKTQLKNTKKSFEKSVTNAVTDELHDFYVTENELNLEKEKEIFKAGTDEELVNEIEFNYEQKRKEVQSDFLQNLGDSIQVIAEKTVELEYEKIEETKKKKSEDDVRSHLRGFSRTIPIFLMAYGTKETTIDNFEENIEPEIFEEITGITISEFRKLRDGFDYIDEAGNNRKFKGLFDKIVFNASVSEFMNKKEELSNYFDEEKEDIFNYIPPQETNQIFTPRSVVKLMLDKLEKENPGIFENYNTKFIDLYSKSGLFITEIIKRLNKNLKSQIPNDHERITWILENQIYAVCPSKIIHKIVTNYVYGNLTGISKQNIVATDLSEAAKNEKMQQELQKAYGGKNIKFDVIIGNPPYQDESIGDNKTYTPPIYHKFMDQSYEIAEKVMLITPARFLFNAGSTPKAWNRKMLDDEHLKVVYYESDGSKIFPNTDIKGGIANVSGFK